jgi:hypothetical protein
MIFTMTARTKPAPAKAAKKALRLHGTIARQLGILIVSGKHRPGDIWSFWTVSSNCVMWWNPRRQVLPRSGARRTILRTCDRPLRRDPLPDHLRSDERIDPAGAHRHADPEVRRGKDEALISAHRCLDWMSRSARSH